MARSVVGERRAHAEIEARARHRERRIVLVPQNEAVARRQAPRHRRRVRLGRELHIARHEDVGLGEAQGRVHRPRAPARQRRLGDARDAVVGLIPGRGAIGLQALGGHREQQVLRRQAREIAADELGRERLHHVGAAQHVFGSVDLKAGGEPGRRRNRLDGLLEAKVEIGQRLLLVEQPALHSLALNQANVLEHVSDDLRGVGHALDGEIDRDVEGRLLIGRRPRACAQALRPALRLEQRQQAARAFVAEQIGDEHRRLGAVVRLDRGHREGQGELPLLLEGNDVEPSGQAVGCEERLIGLQWTHVAVGNGGELRLHPALELGERLAPEDHQRHDVGRVMAVVETNELVADRAAVTVGKRLQAADHEARHGVLGVECLPACRPAAAPVVLDVDLVLGVHDLPLALDELRCEQRRGEELGEPVQRGLQVGRVHIEVVVGVVEGRVGVVAAAVRTDELLILARVRILLRAQEQHVLEKVREPLAALRVAAAAHVHVEGRGRLLSGGVRDEQHLHAVVQHQVLVGTRVVRARDDRRGERRRRRERQDNECDQHPAR